MKVTAGLVECGTKCGGKHPFNQAKRQECERIKACACNMSGLAAINPNLYLAALRYCNTKKKAVDRETFLCEQIGGEALYKQYSLQACGYDPFDSAEATLSAEKKASTNRLLSISLGVLLFFGLLLFLTKTIR